MIIRPKPIEDLLANPDMGWQTFGRFADEDRNLAGLPSGAAYFRFYWRDIEREEGKIDFDRFDTMIEHAKRVGQKLSLRVMNLGDRKDITIYVPQWLKDSGCKGFEYHYQKGETLYWVPDFDDPKFKAAHSRLIHELGRRYDGHPVIDHVDIGSVGLWGELHMAGTGLKLPPLQTRFGIVDLYREAFPRTPKVMLIGDVDSLRYAVARGCGWRADCFGDMRSEWSHMRDRYRQSIEKSGAEDAWKHAPVAFESCWDMRRWKQEGWDIRYIFDYGLDMHASYLNNKSAPLPEGVRPEVERFIRKMGYRLVARTIEHEGTFKPGAPLTVAMEWENIGVAPPYGHYQVALRLSDSAGKPLASAGTTSIHLWLPGRKRIVETLPLPRGIRPGRYSLSVGVVDPVTREPAVRLAIAGRAADGWYPLSAVEVK